MKKSVIYIAAFLITNFIAAQDAKEVLINSFEASKEVTNGSYDMAYTWKILTKKDTIKLFFSSDFKKIASDTLFQIYFRYRNPMQDVWYSGNELIWINKEDNVATILPKDEQLNYIYKIKHNYRFFSPIINSAKFFEKILDDKRVELKMNKDEKDFYKVSILIPDDYDSISGTASLNAVKVLYILKDSYLPVQLDNFVDVVMNNDTMHQYISLAIKNYSFNKEFSSDFFSIEALPDSLILKEFTPAKELPLLSEGTKSPVWKLKELKGETISSDDFEGKLLLVDFFYKSCFPCLKAMPALQSLHEKYSDKGLNIIGINPYDKDEDDLKKFLTKQGIFYRILLSENTFPQEFNVTGYPTLYLIDKDGKIVYAKAGFSEAMEKELEEIILRYL